MTLFRPQRGGLAEAMDDVVEVDSLVALARHLGCSPSALTVEDNGTFDKGIGWQTYIVIRDAIPCGFTNGPLL